MRIVRFLVVLLALSGVGLLVAGPATAYPAGVIATAAINKTLFAPGDTVVVTVQHTTPGPLSMQIFSAPVTIGTGTAGADGSGSVSGVVPVGYSGAHAIQVTGAGGDIFTFDITVTSSGGTTPPGGGGLPCTNPPTVRVLNRHSIAFSEVCAPAGVRFTLTDGAWSGSFTGRSGIATDLAHLLPVGTSTVSFVGRDSSGALVASGSFQITIGGLTTPTPIATVTSTGGGGAQGTGGALASTGAQVGLGLALGLAAVVAGGFVLLVSRRRSARH